MLKFSYRSLRLLVCLLLCACLCVTALAADEPTAEPTAEPVTGQADGYEYSLADGTLTITGCSSELEGKVTIPATLDGHKVTALGERAFAGCEKVTEVVIPKGVKAIGAECFADSGVTKVTLPQTVESIGAGAFAAPTMQTVSVNKNNKKFSSSKGVLFNKKKTTLVCYPAAKTGTYTLPDTVKKIGARAFDGSALTGLKISGRSKLATVGERAFSGSALTAVSLPKTVTSLGAGAFENCAALQSAKLGAGITELPGSTFFGCGALETVSLSKNLTSVGEGAFENCAALKELNLPGVKTIGERAFTGCAALSSVTLPNTLTAIPGRAFENCTALKELRLPPRTETVGERAFAGSGLTAVRIPASVTEIGAGAFDNCTALTDVSFDHDPSDPLTIGKDAFAHPGQDGTTVRVPTPDEPGAALNGYDWEGDGRAVTWAQNESFSVRTVKLTEAANAFTGVEVRWEDLEGAKTYTVLRRESEDADWERVGASKTSPYVDITAISGRTYHYTVQGDNGEDYSRYDRQGVAVDYVAAPELSSVYGNYSGVVLQWRKVGGAPAYRVMRRTGGGSWDTIGDTQSGSFTDRSVFIGQSYTYTVCAVSEDGDKVLSAYDPVGRTIVYYPLPAPNGLALKADSSAVHFSWNAVNGAPLYRVFRRTGSGDWVYLADTTATKFADYTAAIGTSYTYTVRCVTADGRTYLSNYNSGVGLRRAGIPGLTSLTNVNGGVEVKWNAAPGAVNYRVFRKSGSDSWRKVGDTTGTSFVDKSAASGTKYTYTVRCVTSDGSFYAGDYDRTGRTITYLAAPRLQSIHGGNHGIEITWGGSRGAAKYRVFRKIGSGSWQKLTDTTGTSYVDGSVSAGTGYIYTVRCVSADGSTYTSGYNGNGLTLKYAAIPALKGAQKVSGGVQITWSKASGAASYRVFRKTGGGSWQRVGDTSGTSLVDSNVKSGVTYTYTVRPLASNGTYAGGYNGSGVSVTP